MLMWALMRSGRGEGGDRDTETQRLATEGRKIRGHGLAVLLRTRVTRAVGTDTCGSYDLKELGTARWEVFTKGRKCHRNIQWSLSPSPSQLLLVLSVACSQGAREMPSAGLLSQDRKGQSKSGTGVFEVEQIEMLTGLE